MLVQRCTLDQHRIIVPVSVFRPLLKGSEFQYSLSQSQYRALVDTGAQRTVISHPVIAEQNLSRIGHLQFASLHGPKTHTRYLAGLGLWVQRIEPDLGQINQNPSTYYGLEEPFDVVDMDPNANFDLILGWDVLKKFSFSYDQSTKHFDIVVQA